MNKKSLLSFCAFGATILWGFVTVQIMSLFDISKWVGVSVGLALFVAMVVLELVNVYKLKKRVRSKIHIVVLTINALADGLAASSLFVHMGAFPNLWQTAIVFIVMLAAFALYLTVTYIQFARQHYIISMIVYGLILCAIGISCMICVEGAETASALALLFMIVFIAFFVSLPIEANSAPEHLKHVAYCSFAALATVIIVVLVVLSEGDFDISGVADGGSASTKNKKHNPYAYMPYDYAAFAAIATADRKNARYGKPPEAQENTESKTTALCDDPPSTADKPIDPTEK